MFVNVRRQHVRGQNDDMKQSASLVITPHPRPLLSEEREE